MKKIFDWMRKQPLKGFKVYDGSIGVEPSEVNRLIDEAEAKWKSDCCEVVPFDDSGLSEMLHKERVYMGCDKRKDKMTFSRWFIDEMKFCPYCGKPIKISEVE